MGSGNPTNALVRALVGVAPAQISDWTTWTRVPVAISFPDHPRDGARSDLLGMDVSSAFSDCRQMLSTPSAASAK